MKFRKKPVVIEAFQFTGEISLNEIPSWMSNAISNNDIDIRKNETEEHPKMLIRTLEGVMEASLNDYIIKGVKGELYPCKPDIFEMTYDVNIDFDQAMNQDENVIADKTLRVNLDAELQNLKALDPSRERSLAITKLQESIMWLGMDLKRLNESSPYPNSYDPSNTKIEPTADGMKM